jgi:IclR family mhp operon transcriptional activator
MQPKPIRAVSRALAVLVALNRHGTTTALQLARDSGVPRATVYRVLQTLIDDGYVARNAAGDGFRLRLRVRTLSDGFEDEQWISGVAAPVLAGLTRRILWPCDVATLEGLRMVIRETTHRTAPLSIDRGMIGRALPLLASATGLAYLAFAPEPERAALLRLLAASDDPADAAARQPATAGRLLAATRRRGCGLRQGGALWPHTGSLALPIRHRGRVLGCANVVWMSRVMSQQDGVQRCLPPLREAVAEIEARLAAGDG